MKVELSIKDDKELRNLVKDMIKGQILSVAREEIRSIVKEVFEQKFNGTLRSINPEEFLKRELQEIVRAELVPSRYRDNKIKEEMQREVAKLVREILSK